MIVRLSKALLVLLVGLFALLVGVDNIVDYGTNYAFVEHVMAMDTVFPNSTLKWRAITSPPLQQLAYAGIIAAEIATGVLCILGAILLWRARGAAARRLQRGKGRGGRRPHAAASRCGSSASSPSAASGSRCGSRRTGTDRKPHSASSPASASC